MLYSQYRVWRTENLRKVDGVLVATDRTQEWMLPWWWEHYVGCNDYPVAFVDFGMSEKMKEWCSERGELIPLPLSDVFVVEQEEIEEDLIRSWKIDVNTYSSSRRAWFKKPFACLWSPFRRTLWLDLDCEVRGSLAPLFDVSTDPSGIALYEELISDPYPIYNSGVISFQRGIPLIEAWAAECFSKNHHYRGDQEVISHLIAKLGIGVGRLSRQMNWLRWYGEASDILVFHRCGEIAHRNIFSEIETRKVEEFRSRFSS